MSHRSPIRSRSFCPSCGSPLYYVRTFFYFLTGKHKRVCRAPGCDFQDYRRFRITGRGQYNSH